MAGCREINFHKLTPIKYVCYMDKFEKKVEKYSHMCYIEYYLELRDPTITYS